ncbi:hypothetical protein ACI7BZ_08005 [Xanthobacter sp. AM11]|uniref:hypothetical protein n=1 Tax=Xanthobacter sp. AM11 TaxID=3380643 RepID=UPI0039BF81A4
MATPPKPLTAKPLTPKPPAKPAAAKGTTKGGLSRGTPGYAINFFRSDILVNLQLDLKRLERSGIDEEVCSRVRFLLSALVSSASAEPKASLWGSAIYEILRDYEDVYRKWNDVKGADAAAIDERDRMLRTLQDIRHKIANACRKNAHSLSEEHDLALIDSIHKALVETIQVVPGVFTALTTSAERFGRRAVPRD